jgi:hypothetical protein
MLSAGSEIERFLGMLYSSIDEQIRVARVGNDVHEIAAFAQGSGFTFSGDELGQYIAEQLDTRLSAEEKGARAESFKHAGDGPIFSDRDHPGRVEIRDAAPAIILDRAPVLAGDIVIVRGSPTFAALVQHIRDTLTTAFGDADPTTAHVRLDEQTYHARVQQVDQALSDDPAVLRLIADFVRSLGWPAQGIGYFGPFVRYSLPPVYAGAEGYFSKVAVRYTSRHRRADGATAVLNAHRDTWFGAPFHQLNFWAPLYPYQPGSGLVLLPGLFTRSLRNNTAGFDVWRAKLGYAVGPMWLEEVERTEQVHADLEFGQFIVFSANHFHGTGSNVGPASRISIELRLVCEDDRQNGVRSPNVDYHGIGELSQFRTLQL